MGIINKDVIMENISLAMSSNAIVLLGVCSPSFGGVGEGAAEYFF